MSLPQPSHSDPTSVTARADDDDENENEEVVSETDTKATTTDPSPTSAKKVPMTRLLALAKPEWPIVALAFLLMVASEGLGLYTPLLLANAYNYLVDPTLTTPQRMGYINHTMVLVIVLHLTSVVASFLRTALLGATGERVVARLRNDLFATILKQDIAFFDEHKTGELVSRLSSDTTLLQQATSQAFPEVILGIVKLVVSIVLMFWISPSLAAITLGAVIVVFVLCLPFGKWMGDLSKVYQDILGMAQTVSTEALGAMRTVQSFTAEQREQNRYRAKIGDPATYPLWWPSGRPGKQETTYGVGFFKSLAAAAFFTIVFGLGFGSLYIVLWYGFKLVSDSIISLGSLTAFQSYVFQIGAALGTTSNFLAQLVQAQGASGRIFYLLDRVPDIPKSGPPPQKEVPTTGESSEPPPDEETPEERVHNVLLAPASMQGLVEFRHVDFSYPSRPGVPVLRDFSLSVPPNTTAALVGSSGAGKSTVVSLLQRFYDVTGGSICVDGIDVRDLDLKWLRSRMGFVQQEPVLFGMTCRENVVYGVDRDVSKLELEAACRAARAHDFITEWPDKYDTLVGERGVKLSGGQKQRLSIARALLVNPRILLLDEATSALDAESEHLVQEAIEKAMVGRTVLIVAHRLSTIQKADQIVVMDNCHIVDVGSHGVLLQRCSKYQDLIKRQSMVGTLPSTVTETLRDDSSVLHEEEEEDGDV